MKLFKFICGSDEKIGVFEDEGAAYDRRTEVDPTFHFLPVQILEVTLPGYVINITPVVEGEVTTVLDPLKMSADELKAWLDSKGIIYHLQLGERKLRDLVVLKMAVIREDGEQ